MGGWLHGKGNQGMQVRSSLPRSLSSLVAEVGVKRSHLKSFLGARWNVSYEDVRNQSIA